MPRAKVCLPTVKKNLQRRIHTVKQKTKTTKRNHKSHVWSAARLGPSARAGLQAAFATRDIFFCQENGRNFWLLLSYFSLLGSRGRRGSLVPTLNCEESLQLCVFAGFSSSLRPRTGRWTAAVPTPPWAPFLALPHSLLLMLLHNSCKNLFFKRT